MLKAFRQSNTETRFCIGMDLHDRADVGDAIFNLQSPTAGPENVARNLDDAIDLGSESRGIHVDEPNGREGYAFGDVNQAALALQYQCLLPQSLPAGPCQAAVAGCSRRRSA